MKNNRKTRSRNGQLREDSFPPGTKIVLLQNFQVVGRMYLAGSKGIVGEQVQEHIHDNHIRTVNMETPKAGVICAPVGYLKKIAT